MHLTNKNYNTKRGLEHLKIKLNHTYGQTCALTNKNYDIM